MDRLCPAYSPTVALMGPTLAGRTDSLPSWVVGVGSVDPLLFSPSFLVCGLASLVLG